ncbi:MAG: hypothetical protein EPO35_01215 [Acidobacteria bacterium]|nr:MAG: hypothetical protein EPO35_01215 [Acidobacteriota bacterium]
MWSAAAAIVMAAMLAAPDQQAPSSQPGGPVPFPCDADGAIRCSYQQVETVTGSRSLDDMRIISKYIQLVAERNRRYYISWQTKAPSAAYELVKRVKSFPYLPYGDSYSIVGLEIALNQSADTVTVKYPMKPKPNSLEPIPDKDHAVYSTKLSDFIKGLEKEIVKLKKYEKGPGLPH